MPPQQRTHHHPSGSTEPVLAAACLDLVEGFWHALDSVARERRYLIFTQAPPLEETLRFVSDLIEKRGSCFWALQDGEVVGWCDIVRHGHPGRTHAGCLGMGVVAAHREKGLGRRLLEATIADAFAKGLERIELEVFAGNLAAQRLYLSAGFVEEGRKRAARFLDGAYEDIILMALPKASLEGAQTPAS